MNLFVLSSILTSGDSCDSTRFKLQVPSRLYLKTQPSLDSVNVQSVPPILKLSFSPTKMSLSVGEPEKKETSSEIWNL